MNEIDNQKKWPIPESRYEETMIISWAYLHQKTYYHYRKRMKDFCLERTDPKDLLP